MSESFNELSDLEVVEVSSVDVPANLRKFALFKKRDHQPDSMEEIVDQEEKTPEVEAVESVEKAETAVEEVEQVEEQVALTKAHEELEAVKKEKEDLAKALDEARAAMAEKEDQELAAQFVAKARDEFSAIAKQEDEVKGLGDMLKKLYEMDKELAQKVEEMLKKCADLVVSKDAAIEGGVLLEEIGKAGEPEEVSAYDMIKKEAARLREIDPSLSDAQARSKVLEMKPDLYNLYVEGK